MLKGHATKCARAMLASKQVGARVRVGVRSRVKVGAGRVRVREGARARVESGAGQGEAGSEGRARVGVRARVWERADRAPSLSL